MPMVKAVIFDFDGVIVDSEPLHFKAFQAVLYGVKITFSQEEYWTHYLAMSDKDLFKAISQQRGVPLSNETIKELMRAKADQYMKLLQEEPVFFHGIKQVITSIARYFPLAIASGALRNEILYALQRLGIEQAFKCIVSAEDVSEGKPNPQIFSMACKKLQSFVPTLSCDQCLVIEDSVHGVIAAHNAQMKCLAVAHSYKEEDLQHADAIIAHVSQLNVDLLKSLFN